MRMAGSKKRALASGAMAASLLALASMVLTATVSRENALLEQRLGLVPGSHRKTMFSTRTFHLRDEFRWQPSDAWWIRYRNHQETAPPHWTLPGSLGPERIAELPNAGFQVRAGWPFRAFIGEPGERRPHRYPIPGRRHAAIIGPFTIPTKPLWSGLIANLAIHTAAWAVLLPVAMWPFRAARRAIVRHQRKDNGLCLNCGYDVYDQPSGSKCPECGEARW